MRTTLIALIALIAVTAIGCKSKSKTGEPAARPPPTAASDVAVPSEGDAASGEGKTDVTRQPSDLPPEADVALLAAANNEFAFDLWARITAMPGNLAVSPASITTALAMTWGGARGETAAEMRRVLGLEGDAAAVMAAWGTLAGALQSPARPFKLRIANRLFGDKAYKFETAYLDQTRAAYGAALEPVDFAGAPEPARARINGWVEEQTERRLKDLLPPRSIDQETRLVLVNAIYFLADWAMQFAAHQTRERPFSVSAKVTRPVRMMHKRGSFDHVKADGVAVLKLPYVGGDAAMIVVLPDEVDGLAAIEQSLDAAKLAGWMAAFQHVEVEVSFPRFTIDPPGAMDLGKALQGLGMKRAFDAARADFTGIADPASSADRLVIGAVFHKAFVKVDEKGTEAAAATAVAMPRGGRAVTPPAITFDADHPFLFFIVDTRTKLILFMGRFVEPRG